MIKIENRATVVLYRFLKSNFKDGIFLLPANICPIVPLTFLKAGVGFIFVDIDHTHVMNRSVCLELITKKQVDGILFVHAYGKFFDNDSFYQKLKKIEPNLVIIDDKCLCIPNLSLEIKENIDLELFSTGYSKYIDLNYGGWGIVNDSYLYIEDTLPYNYEENEFQMKSIRNSLLLRKKFEYIKNDWLDTSPFDSMEAYFEQIKSKLECIKQHKEEINSIYNELLPDQIKFDVGYDNWRYMIQIKNKNKLIEEVKDSKLFLGTNFPSVASIFNNKKMKIAEAYQQTNINLFNDFRINKYDAEKMCKIIRKYV